MLELDDLSPEAAARVTVNGQYAGGFIGRPFRLDVTRLLRTGPNTIRIEPFAPRTAQLVVTESTGQRSSDPTEGRSESSILDQLACPAITWLLIGAWPLMPWA